MIRREAGDAVLHDVPDYPSPYTGGRYSFYVKFLLSLPGLFRGIRREHTAVEALHRRLRFRRVISDNRYGVHLRGAPSYLITHQMRFLAPGRIRLFERRSERFVANFSDRFAGYLIPDEEEGGLTGDLSHDLLFVRPEMAHYVGILSDFRAEEVDEDIDLFVSISGPEPQRTRFERMVMEQVRGLEGLRVVVSRGTSESDRVRRDGPIEIHDYMPAPDRAAHLSRARVVVTRSGYSTLMDLAAMGKHALLVPTPGQTEQEYLARKHLGERHWAYQDQRRFDLRKGQSRALALIPPRMSAERTVDRVFGAVDL
ncbi:MAG TPA: hypothetical protein EYP43_03605 [Thermoplasmata archaeon]|nr:hypothetical protein [Thermoplasmata archaeon]